MWDRAAEYFHFYIAVFWFIVELGWVSAVIIGVLAVTLVLCLAFLSWTINLCIYVGILCVYMYFRQNYYGMNKLPGYVEPTEESDEGTEGSITYVHFEVVYQFSSVHVYESFLQRNQEAEGSRGASAEPRWHSSAAGGDLRETQGHHHDLRRYAVGA